MVQQDRPAVIQPRHVHRPGGNDELLVLDLPCAPRRPSPWLVPRRLALVPPAAKPPALPPVILPAAPARSVVPLDRVPGFGLAKGVFAFRAVHKAA